jgi:hypothetical protein
MAMRLSVTVSIAALARGVLTAMFRENLLATFTLAGTTFEWHVLVRTSSKDNAKPNCSINAKKLSHFL